MRFTSQSVHLSTAHMPRHHMSDSQLSYWTWLSAADGLASKLIIEIEPRALGSGVHDTAARLQLHLAVDSTTPVLRGNNASIVGYQAYPNENSSRKRWEPEDKLAEASACEFFLPIHNSAFPSPSLDRRAPFHVRQRPAWANNRCTGDTVYSPVRTRTRDISRASLLLV